MYKKALHNCGLKTPPPDMLCVLQWSLPWCLSRPLPFSQVSSVQVLSQCRLSSTWGHVPPLGASFLQTRWISWPGSRSTSGLRYMPQSTARKPQTSVPNETFSVCIQHRKEACIDVTKYFKVSNLVLEKWSFLWVLSPLHSGILLKTDLISYYEDLFAKDAGSPVVVNVASKAYCTVIIIALLLCGIPSNPEPCL